MLRQHLGKPMLSRVGELDELVSTTLRRLYLKDLVGRGLEPHLCKGVVIDTALSRQDDTIGNSQLKILNTPTIEARFLYTQCLD
jgi:hypothetical protein